MTKLETLALALAKERYGFFGYSKDTIDYYVSMTYYLFKNRYACKSVRNITLDDMFLIFDNLAINNEIISQDNYMEYDLDKLGISKSYQTQIKNGNKDLLLNYYDVNDNLHECRVYLQSDYRLEVLK